MAVPRTSALVAPRAFEREPLDKRPVRRLCECGRPIRSYDKTCARCKRLDGSGHLDGIVIAALRDVRMMSLMELVEIMDVDVRSAQRVLRRMLSRGRLERVDVPVQQPTRAEGSDHRWLYRLRS